MALSGVIVSRQSICTLETHRRTFYSLTRLAAFRSRAVIEETAHGFEPELGYVLKSGSFGSCTGANNFRGVPHEQTG